MQNCAVNSSGIAGRPEIVDEVPVQDVVKRTVGCSFAEVDEFKKLLVLQHLETGRDWPAEWVQFLQRGADTRLKRLPSNWPFHKRNRMIVLCQKTKFRFDSN